ncbi:vacuolar protein sorting-associated protein 8 homolog isoform X3 [Centruroides vittatus]
MFLHGEHGCILRHVILRGISSQLQSAEKRVNAGKPTAMAVSSVIAIGTFHGLVLVFDSQQVLKWCLGNTNYGEEFGSVSALGFNSNCTRLLCGYSEGQITMWDLTNGKLLRTILDAHPPQTAVLHIKFTDDPTLALCSDSGGSVFELNFKRVMGARTCDPKCIFSGSRGEVCAFEPLRLSPEFRNHPSQEVCLVALGTVTKLIVVTVRPSLQVWFTHPLRANPDTLPIISWQFVVVQIWPATRIFDPVLAFGRQNNIYFYQVHFVSAEKINFIPLQQIELNYTIQNFTWLNSRTLVTMDTLEHLHVIDVRSTEELEVTDLAEVQLVYGSSHYKGLFTGGNVSKAMTVAGERACYHSLAAFGSQILLLGLKSVHVLTLRTWNERIDVLLKQKLYSEALALALSFYEERAKAVAGLLGKKHQRQEQVANKILEVLGTYADQIMTQLCPEHGKIELLIQHYQMHVPLCVQYCIAINQREFLFGKIFERFSVDPACRGIFLESLESYILDEVITYLPPTVAKEFVDHYSDKQQFNSLEACLVHLDILSFDIHQVMKLCWAHGLYDGILYIYNKGMEDYITPLEDLLGILRRAVSSGKQLTDAQIILGNKLLVYISCCLAGRSYPKGDIPQEKAKSVKTKVFECVVSLHSNKHDDVVYPYLKTLLHFDTREFLNVLALAFEEEEFVSCESINQRQRVVDILLQIMVESEGFSPTQVGALFTFLARQMAKHENSIIVNRLLFEQVIEFLTNPKDDTRVEERQQALIELLQAGGLAEIDEDRLLNLAEGAKFYRVCEYLYQQKQQFDKILTCYLQDPSRKPQVFYYAWQILESQRYTLEQKQSLETQIIASIEEIIDIDNKKISEMLTEFFPHRLHEIVDKLDARPFILYQLLQGLFNKREMLQQSSPSQGIKDNFEVNPNVQEKYIELMCRYNPEQVYGYVRSTEGYRLEETLEICRRYKVMDATAYVLEKAGDIHGAFDIMLESLRKRVGEVTRELEEKGGLSKCVTWSKLNTELLVIVQLCQRNSSQMDQEARGSLWFPLLEAVVAPQRHRGKADAEFLQALKELTKDLLNNMMGYVTLPAILQRIVQDPAYATGKFCEIRELIMGMFDTYNYEKTLLSTVNNLLYHDLHAQLSQLRRVANRRYSSHPNVCNLCNKDYLSACRRREVLLFKCGHSFHLECLDNAHSVRVDEEGVQTWSCHRCSRDKSGKKSSGGVRIVEKSAAPARHKGPAEVGKGKAGKSKVTLDPWQLAALQNLKRYRTSSNEAESAGRSPRRKRLLSAAPRPGPERKEKVSSGLLPAADFVIYHLKNC